MTSMAGTALNRRGAIDRGGRSVLESRRVERSTATSTGYHKEMGKGVYKSFYTRFYLGTESLCGRWLARNLASYQHLRKMAEHPKQGSPSLPALRLSIGFNDWEVQTDAYAL